MLHLNSCGLFFFSQRRRVCNRSRDATLHDDQEMSRSQAPRVFTSSDVSLASASLVDEVDSRNDHARDDHLA